MSRTTVRAGGPSECGGNRPSVIVLVSAYAQIPEQAPAGAWIVAVPEVGVLHVRAFPDDPRLPMLATVVAGSPQVRVVRYRPRERCTLRIGSDAGTSWVKVFAGMEGQPIHRTQVALVGGVPAG
ncbi:MAG: hypothetical protein H0T99_10395 [Geodermatophilaceae bacterium]|nr:hypothetical protein [Geodermatophilaceae bacterium]